MRIDRYPGKMVTQLAERLMERYGNGAEALFDPYCGSGVILKTAKDFGIKRIAGLDINPIANLLSDIKLNGFCAKTALEKYHQIKDVIKYDKLELRMDWPNIDYWFSPATLHKYELLRGAARQFKLNQTASGRAILLAIALSVRPCSRADQRSPKPFISKNARAVRSGKHFDPIKKTGEILNILSEQYGRTQKTKVNLICANFLAFNNNDLLGDPFSHVMTSPPYINAQDYFRNWKLELYMIEGLLPFRADSIRNSFIGTECGDLLANLPKDKIKYHCALIPHLDRLENLNKRLAAVVHRYLNDMSISVANIIRLLTRNGTLVIVCGDNLIGHMRIETSSVLEKIIKNNGFTLIDKFVDKIRARQLAPKRHGHKGLIKEEIILAFKKV